MKHAQRVIAVTLALVVYSAVASAAPPNILLLLSDEVARKLSEAGTWIVMISLHSHRPHEHDALLEVDGASTGLGLSHF